MATSKQVNFQNHEGLTLSGILDFSILPSQQYAIFAHCFTCSKDLKAVRTISKSLTALGINVFRFDFTGLGKSEGDFTNANFSNNVSDLVAAGQFLKNKYAPASILIGHSLGGTAVLAASEYLEEVKALATVGAPCTPAHIIQQFKIQEKEILLKGEATVELAGRKFKIKRQFIEDIKSFDLENKIRYLKKALLVFHSPVDSVVSITEAAKIYKAARHPKSFISLDNADHMLTKPEDAEYVANVLNVWVKKYLSSEKTHLSSTQGQVIVQSQDDLAQIVITNAHQWMADEPISAGGTDKGPDPYEMLLGSLGACTNMTLKIYAKFKKIDLGDVKTILTHERNHLKDCDSCEKSEARIEKISRKIVVENTVLTPEQIASLENIANKCPVHRTLTSELLIETKLHHEKD